jgi:hypothetical protein
VQRAESAVQHAESVAAIAKQDAANERSLRLKAELATAVAGNAVKSAAAEATSVRAAAQQTDTAAKLVFNSLESKRLETEELKSTLAATKNELAVAAEAKTAAEAEIHRKTAALTAATATRDVDTTSGDPLECGICFEEFNHDRLTDPIRAAARHVFWPCQHARQCGECAKKIWKTKKQSRSCPWCAAKIESRPRPLAPFV